MKYLRITGLVWTQAALASAVAVAVAACGGGDAATGSSGSPSTSGSSGVGASGNSGAAGSTSGGSPSGSTGSTTGGAGSSTGSIGSTTGSAGSMTGSSASPDDAGGMDDAPANAPDAPGTSGTPVGDASGSPDSSVVPPVGDGAAPAQNDGGPAVDAALLAKCSGQNPIACHFGGNPGNYEVTVELGGAAAAQTSVMAEISREMLAPVTTAAGQTARYTMTVNVRHPEGQPVADLNSSPSGLDLYFWGNGSARPLLHGIGFAPAVNPIVVYVATDSTGCDQTDTAYAGWAQWLPQYFASPVVIANYGNSGVNSPGVAGGSAYWGAIQPLLTSKDFLLIELGDNDKTDSESAISSALTSMVTGAKAKGATPILMTPVNRALFTGSTVNGYLSSSTGANVPTIMKQIGQAQNVTVLDMTTRSTEWLQSLGPNGWHTYFALGSNGKYDSTHLNQAGASVVGGFVRDLMVAAHVPVLTTYVR